MKANFICNSFILFVLVTWMLAACKPSEQHGNSAASPAGAGALNAFNVPGQMIAADSIYSIQLFRKGNPGSPPILELNRNEQLHLLFEIIELDSRQLQISFSHHNPDWSRSAMPPEFFHDGFSTQYLNSGELSQNQRPDYRQYSYEFPNEQISFHRSGNYMLKVEDTQTGHLLFTLPFFVFENEGSVRSSVETSQAPRRDLRITHRPVSLYQLPEIADQPLFDLEFYYVQNQFWGRSRKAGELDFSDEHEVQFGLSQEEAFIGDYELLYLPLTSLSPSNPLIFDTDPVRIPPHVQIADDAQGFSSGGFIPGAGRYGLPDTELRSSYAEVFFTLDPEKYYPESAEIYLTGDFNNWSIRPDNRLRYNRETDRWQINVIIKQGEYSYKYILLQDGEVNDLEFDDLFAQGQQEYHALVYMRDHQQFYYRLLQVNRFFQDF